HFPETNGRQSTHKSEQNRRAVNHSHARRGRQASIRLRPRQLMHARSSALHASMTEHMVANPASGRAEVELTMTHSNHGPFLEAVEPNLSASQDHSRRNITNSALRQAEVNLSGLFAVLNVP